MTTKEIHNSSFIIHNFPYVLLSGALLGLSQPLVIRGLGEAPVNSGWVFGLLCLVGYVPLLHAMRGRGPWHCFVLGFGAASVQLLIITHWVVVAMAVFGGVPFLSSCAVSVLLALVFAVHTGAACGMTALITRALGWPVWAVFPPVLCAWEWLRNFTLFDGFPWGNAGYSLGSVPVPRQAAALVGTYGLVFFIGLVNSCIAWAGDPKSRGARRTPVLLTAAVTGVLLAWGVYRLSVPAPFEQTVRVALLQGNIEQGIKNRAAYYGDQILRKYARLEARAIAQGAELVIWPEAAYPGIHRHGAPAVAGLPPVAAARVVGAVVRQGDQYYNSAVALNPRGQVVGRMDKNHMVPFGEYVPWPLKSVVKRLVPAAGDFPEVIGNTPVPVDIPLPSGRVVRLGAAICFDGVFPEVSRAFARRGAELLVNVTNDAWFGVSSATFQHLGMYVMRSTELGRVYARAANTGVSAWVDARGRVHRPTRL
ncbi:MAG: apolipoprotein N-acyltransferase, partial [Myxococcota bacterium]